MNIRSLAQVRRSLAAAENHETNLVFSKYIQTRVCLSEFIISETLLKNQGETFKFHQNYLLHSGLARRRNHDVIFSCRISSHLLSATDEIPFQFLIPILFDIRTSRF